jgi:predicted transposase YbfD/YdcC
MINTSIIAITDNIRVFFDSPYQIENALVSKLFNTQENANKVIVEKQFSDNVNLITVIQFNQCNIKIEKENGYITIIIGQKKIDFNLKNVLIDVREIK